MSVKRGRLKPEDEYKIQTNWILLQSDLDPSEHVLDYMISKLVFDSEDRDHVMNGGEKTRKERVARFLNKLQMAGEDAYKHFVAALRDGYSDHIADALEQTPVPMEAKQEPFAWIKELPSTTKNCSLTASNASRFSAAFGNGYEHIFFALGLTKAKIEQEQMTSSYSISLINTNLLIAWIQRNGRSAQLIRLLEALEKVNDQCTIDWDLVQKLVKQIQ